MGILHHSCTVTQILNRYSGQCMYMYLYSGGQTIARNERSTETKNEMEVKQLNRSTKPNRTCQKNTGWEMKISARMYNCVCENGKLRIFMRLAKAVSQVFSGRQRQ